MAERATPWMDGVPVGRGHSQGKEWRDDRWGRGEACGFLAVGGSLVGKSGCLEEQRERRRASGGLQLDRGAPRQL